MPTALLDTTLLSNFAHIRRADLLRLALGEEAATTLAIIAELRAGEALGLVPSCDWNWLTVLEPTDEERRLAADLERQLDPGEAEGLAVAQMRQCKFLSDDFAVRRLARQRGLVVSGTLGVLLALIDEKNLSLEEADSLLTIMTSHGYRSPVRSLQELLA
jgi:predicted nucleic acid-binding protein